MADKKISQLTALSAANLAPSTDVLAIVDTSATETKKIAAQDIVNGVLNVASTVGIGTASPGRKLDVVAANGTAIRALSGASGSYVSYGVGRTAEEAYISIAAATNNFITGSAAGDLTINNNTGNVLITAGGSNTQLYLSTSGNLGLGTASPGSVGISGYTRLVLGAGGSATDGLTIVPSGTGGVQFTDAANVKKGYLQWDSSTGALALGTGGTTKATLDASGNLLVGVTTGSYNIVRKAVTNDGGNATVEFQSTGGSTSQIWYGVSGFNANAANAATKVGRDATTLRSINAGGTVNASGADYAEYMTKAGDFALAKGDVCGINVDGKLTNVFANAISFVVKSTDPSYVGGDSWGAEFKDDSEGLEAARQKVDRIAFAGQVPVNVLGATPGQYIVPINDNGAIKGIAVSNPTFEQYQSAVGKVIAVQDDGRALIIVKVA